jgi:hypothetical protein
MKNLFLILAVVFTTFTVSTISANNVDTKQIVSENIETSEGVDSLGDEDAESEGVLSKSVRPFLSFLFIPAILCIVIGVIKWSDGGFSLNDNRDEDDQKDRPSHEELKKFMEMRNNFYKDFGI